MSFKPSKYQQDIFDFIKTGTGNAIVEAVAGSGKTTTILRALDFINPRSKVLFLAFNKHIASELQAKMPFGFEAKTLHSLGYSIIKENRKVKMQQWKITNIIKESILGKSYNWKKDYAKMTVAVKLIGLIKSLGYHSVDVKEASDIVDHFALDAKNLELGLVIRAWELMEGDPNTIDFDDMIWVPVHDDLTFPKYDYVFVDEAQDLSPIQVDFLARLLGDSSRLIAVGDTHQAIYGFRGADADCMNRIRNEFNTTEFPLSICYRCPKSVVSLARTLVPHIEHDEDQEDGNVFHRHINSFREKAKSGDYVLCRVTLPLLGECMRQISMGRKACVKGRDIGTGLISMVEGFKAGSIADLTEKLKMSREKALGNAKNEAAKIAIEDRHDCILVLMTDVDTVKALIAKIKKIFTDKLEGIVFSTIHKSKGLEAKNIYILRGDLLPHPRCNSEWQIQQENNLSYVAITRAQETLTWIEE